MKSIIYKYGPIWSTPVDFKGKVVHVGYQDNDVYIWCVLTGHDVFSKAFVVPTGMEYEGEHLGTVVMPSGLVWHVIEVKV